MRVFHSTIITVLVATCLMYIPMSLGQAQDFASLMESGDKAWEKRGTDGDPDNLTALSSYRTAVTLAPFSYEAHWKAARSCWWNADQGLYASENQKNQKELGRAGMDLAERAALIDPDGVEGHLYFALCALHYAYGIGMVDALKEGVYDRAIENLSTAYKKDGTFGGGAVTLGLSALYRVAPWPVRDREKALAYAREATGADGAGLRAMVFLAAAAEGSGMSNEAMNILKTVSEAKSEDTMEPDINRWKRYAKRCVDAGRMVDTERLF
jgi:hypothetical protein